MGFGPINQLRSIAQASGHPYMIDLVEKWIADNVQTLRVEFTDTNAETPGYIRAINEERMRQQIAQKALETITRDKDRCLGPHPFDVTRMEVTFIKRRD